MAQRCLVAMNTVIRTIRRSVNTLGICDNQFSTNIASQQTGYSLINDISIDYHNERQINGLYFSPLTMQRNVAANLY